MIAKLKQPVLSEDVLEDIVSQIVWQSKGKPFDFRQAMFDIERRMIQTALDATKGCRTQAAELLEMGRTTLVQRMKFHGYDKFPQAPSRASD
jgi:DNA-binding NtrC family response regulator